MDGDASLSRRNPPEELADRVLEPEFSLHGQLQDGRGRERLAGGSDLEERVGRVGTVGVIGKPVTLGQNHLTAAGHQHHAPETTARGTLDCAVQLCAQLTLDDGLLVGRFLVGAGRRQGMEQHHAQDEPSWERRGPSVSFAGSRSGHDSDLLDTRAFFQFPKRLEPRVTSAITGTMIPRVAREGTLLSFLFRGLRASALRPLRGLAQKSTLLRKNAKARGMLLRRRKSEEEAWRQRWFSWYRRVGRGVGRFLFRHEGHEGHEGKRRKKRPGGRGMVSGCGVRPVSESASQSQSLSSSSSGGGRSKSDRRSQPRPR